MDYCNRPFKGPVPFVLSFLSTLHRHTPLRDVISPTIVSTLEMHLFIGQTRPPITLLSTIDCCGPPSQNPFLYAYHFLHSKRTHLP